MFTICIFILKRLSLQKHDICKGISKQSPDAQHFYRAGSPCSDLLDPPLGEHYYTSLGEPVSFTYWAPGQPGVIANIGRKRLILDTLTNIHLVEEDCVLLKFSESGHWHDYPCVKLDPLGLVHENYPYVCEYSRIFFLFFSF